jgi:hypothetical protein
MIQHVAHNPLDPDRVDLQPLLKSPPPIHHATGNLDLDRTGMGIEFLEQQPLQTVARTEICADGVGPDMFASLQERR